MQFADRKRAHRQALSSLLLGATFVLLSPWLAGCGGGSGTTTSTTRAALTGQVQAPANRTRAAQTSGSDALVPVTGANVSLIDVSTNQTVATTTTDMQGDYSFSTITAGKNYEVLATKSVTGGTLTLSAIVTVPSSSSTSGETGTFNGSRAQLNLSNS